MLISSDDMEGFRLFAKQVFWIDFEAVDKDETLISEELEIDSSEKIGATVDPLTFRSIFLNDDLYHVAIEKLSEYFSNGGRFIKNRGEAYLIAILYALEYQGYLKKKHSLAEIQLIAAFILGTSVSIETAKFTARVIRGKYDEILRLLPNV